MTKPISPTGYSGTPLYRKLCIKEGMRLYVVNPPSNYADLIADAPPITLVYSSEAELPLIHFFTLQRAELEALLPSLANLLTKDGTLWISWAKKSAKISTDITEETLRDVALPMGLVDVKVCAVDAIWSGLKLVWRVERR